MMGHALARGSLRGPNAFDVLRHDRRVSVREVERATLSPARMRRSSISGDSEAGPMVATILSYGQARS